MRTYFCLYLFSPVVNQYLENISTDKRFLFLLSLGFISTYMGTMAAADSALNDGKNLVNFIFLYTVGDTLHVYQDKWRRIPLKKLIGIYLLLNILLVAGYCIFNDSFIGKAIWKLSFPYCSPLLIVNAVLFLIILAKHPFKSKAINYMAASSLAIYLLHGIHFIFHGVIGPVALYLYAIVGNTMFFFVAIILTLIIVFAAIGIDKLLTPIWNLFHHIGESIDKKLSINGHTK